MNYFLHLMVMIEIYLILSLSLNLLVGYTGLLTLAHAAFYGIGAYVTTILMVSRDWNFFPALIVAVGVVSIISLIISYSAIRFKGDYFVLATLAFQTIVYAVLYNWINLTRGPYGIPGIPKPNIFGMHIDSIWKFAVFGAVISFIVYWFYKKIMLSPFGRMLKGIRDDELAIKSLGKNTLIAKIKSVALASTGAAIAGALYASYVTYIDPTSFTIEESILLISMIIIGGSGNIRGPVIGALTLVLLPEVLRFIAIPDSIAPNIRLIIYGSMLILMMFYRPQGIAGDYKLE